VIGVFTPWNFPIAIPAWKIVPALAYGNAVVEALFFSFSPERHVAGDHMLRKMDRLVDLIQSSGLKIMADSESFSSGS
jgi:hypothetical protein